MTKITDKTVKSKYPPKQTNVTWIDTSQKPAVTKSYIDGKWVVVGGGVTDYNDIKNKPTINDVELDGNKTAEELGLSENLEYYSEDTQNSYVIIDDASEFQVSVTDGVNIHTSGNSIILSEEVNTGVNLHALGHDVRLSSNGFTYDGYSIATEDMVESAISNVKRFKGWYASAEELIEGGNAEQGDYAYIPDAAPATTASIYAYDSTASSTGYWADTGKKADTSNVQTFASGEEVNEVHIVDDLTTGGVDDVLSAEQGKGIGNSLKIDYTKSVYYEQLGLITTTGGSTTSSAYTRYIIKNDGYLHIKVTAYTSSSYMAIAFYNSLDWGTASFMSEDSVVGRNWTNSYSVDVPNNCKCIIVCNNTSQRPLPIIELIQGSCSENLSEKIIDIQSDNGLGVDCRLSVFPFKDGKGLSDSSGVIINNGETITSEEYYKISDYAIDGKIYFSYKGSSTNTIHKAVAFYDSNKTFLYRCGYNPVDYVTTPFNAVYFRLSLGLHDGQSSIGGHSVDYDLGNAYIRKSLNVSFNERNYVEDLPKALGLDNADKVLDGYDIYYSNGNITTRTNSRVFIFKNYGFTKIEAHLGANSTTYSAISFYNSDEPNENSYISGIASINTEASDYSTIIPEGTKTIAISANVSSVTPYATIYSKSLKSAFDKMDDRYEEIKEKIGDKTDIVSLNSPLQMPRLLQQLKFVGGIKNPNTLNPLVLLHFSDIHGGNTETKYVINKTTLQRIVDFNAAYKDYIDDILCTGDECFQDITDRQDYDNSEDWWDSIDGSQYILPVLGNHDTYASGSTTNGSAGQSVSYNVLFNHIEDCNPTNHPDGKCYYYKDYTEQGIRLIVIDPYYSDNDEEVWFAAALANAKTNSLSVIIAIHPPFNSYTPIDCTFNSLKFNGSFIQHVSYSNYFNMVDDFISNGGELICWLTGHVHGDVVGYTGTERKHLMITAPSSKAPRSIQTTSETNNVDMRIVGTKSQDSFNIIGCNTTYKTITIMRIGSDYDVALRHRGICVIKYDTMEVLYNN